MLVAKGLGVSTAAGRGHMHDGGVEAIRAKGRRLWVPAMARATPRLCASAQKIVMRDGLLARVRRMRRGSRAGWPKPFRAGGGGRHSRARPFHLRRTGWPIEDEGAA